MLMVTCFAVVMALSWNDYHDHSLNPKDTYENVTNKLYWYVTISREGTWLPFTMVSLLVIFSMTHSLLTPRKPSFRNVSMEYELLKIVSEISNSHQVFMNEVLELVRNDAKERGVREAETQDSINAWINKIRNGAFKIVNAGNRALTKEHKQKLEEMISSIISQKTEEFVAQAEAEEMKRRIEQRAKAQEELTKKLQQIEQTKKQLLPPPQLPPPLPKGDEPTKEFSFYDRM